MSTLKVTNIQATGETASRAVSGVAAAWVHFDQGGTFSVKESFNQSSTTDNGTGDATLSLTNNMGSAYYSFSACAGNGSTGTGISFVAPRTSDPTASAIRMVGFSHAGGVADREFNGWSLHGDLA